MAKAKVILKDELFNEKTVRVLSSLIKRVYIKFDEESFVKDTVSEFYQYELKARISWISKMLDKHIDLSFKDTVQVLLESVDQNNIEGMFAFASYPEYVAEFGCNKENLELSLYMLGEFTKRFSAEFAIRFFINKFPEETYKVMLKWSKSDNVHQRRLVSEGLRPKLPWAKGITFDYNLGSVPLDNLYYDSVRYVTRSVANHLNDLSKMDPDLVLILLTKWQKSSKQNRKEMDYIISHSLRTLVKKGHKETLEFLGYSYTPKIKVNNLEIENRAISIGESIEFSFEIKALKDEQLVIDYKVIYPMANSKVSSKIFKIKKVNLKKNETLKISKKQAFRLMTTKKLYSGDYKLIIQINGNLYEEASFQIKV